MTVEPITFRHGDDARMGGLDITVSLTPTQAKALGAEAGTLMDWMHTALWAMALLRSGRSAEGRPYIAGPNDWHTAVNDLEHRLIPRLDGIRDAVVRAHANSGGSVGDLALAMDVSRSTAQYRRETLLGKAPSAFETWATDGGPEDKGRLHTAAGDHLGTEHDNA
jgi:hypothetical protein